MGGSEFCWNSDNLFVAHQLEDTFRCYHEEAARVLLLLAPQGGSVQAGVGGPRVDNDSAKSVLDVSIGVFSSANRFPSVFLVFFYQLVIAVKWNSRWPVRLRIGPRMRLWKP